MVWSEKSVYQETYIRAAGAIAFIAIVDANGDEGIGSAFHIGDGIFVTARHVIDGVTIKEIATTKSAHLSEETGGKPAPPRRFKIIDGPYYGPDELDVAVFRVDLGGTLLPAITVSQHTDYTLGENDLILSDVLIVGYPPIPFTIVPSQVVTLGQINAVVRVHHSKVLHFIASATARGGFSGGVALDKSGMALALVTESLGTRDTPVETGYMSLLSIEPAVDLAAEKFGFSTHGTYPGRYSDTLFAAKFSDPNAQSLSSFIYDASLYVYDDDRDVLVEFNCTDEALITEALATFNAITPLRRQQVDEHYVLYTPVDNPPASLLLEAGEAVAALFIKSGYKMMASERSHWQIKV
ncbi:MULTISPECIES: S1 family peptidase [Agrobacterium]|uniref:Trypsin-like peptidase domain-containing protein n=1 Tax=Agrobacterium rubi TaxID=28099 RepID=A0AAE7R7G8_9HYPH|nr:MULTISPECIES: serine protease [Agrobacterium]MBN7807710.1 trypsin-like peptidase domain-containing protein [Agrobacterium rosae]NTE89591.1 trypsin-like peptidase domain-containing protein [Agrobacterium rubi]NTF05559.1 trypsin-like peptidase domain-containing protein [Agrobacterium rubi]NTF39999.1 trypsin-like peptidase domain-containing protein [Agrobacterium rubi]OCJ44707.1 peptidase C24 [Agrobacterium rubi]